MEFSPFLFGLSSRFADAAGLRRWGLALAGGLDIQSSGLRVVQSKFLANGEVLRVFHRLRREAVRESFDPGLAAFVVFP
jgi:hypothetical protein